MHIMGLFGLALALTSVAHAETPILRWQFTAKSNLYAAPVISDLHPSPGLETVICDSEARRMRCIGADGRQIWEYDGGWKKRLTSPPAVLSGEAGENLLVVGNSDGTLHAVDGATGQMLWETSVGRVEWSNVVVADAPGPSPSKRILVGCEDSGLTALDTAGRVLWNYRGDDGKPPLSIRTPMAVADIQPVQKVLRSTLVGHDTLFACDKWGPVALTLDGTPLWRAITGDNYYDSSIVVDVDELGPRREGRAYVVSQSPAALQCFNARTGARLWRSPLLGPIDVYSSSGMALGDLNHDGAAELVFSDAHGRVYCFSRDGRLHWTWITDKPTYAGVSLGDVDGDGQPDILVTSGDHTLYCLSADGVLKWRYAASLRLISPPSLADVDGNGRIDILFCGSDHVLRRLEAGPISPQVPWGMRRGEGQRGSRETTVTDTARPTRSHPLLSDGGFEVSALVGNREDYPSDPPVADWLESAPRGWSLANATDAAEAARVWKRDDRVRRTGNVSLWTERRHDPLTIKVVSDAVELPLNLVAVDASVWTSDTSATAHLEWSGFSGVLREDRLALGTSDGEGWARLLGEKTPVPFGARWVRLVLMPGEEAAHWDDAELVGVVAEPPRTHIRVNQAGYDVGMPKTFVVESTDAPASDGLRNATFALLTGDGEVVFEGDLEYKDRIIGAFNSDWGHFYLRGDFTAFDGPGVYRIQVAINATKTVSQTIEIGKNLLWSRTARPGYRFFYYQRCGTAITGYHGACHLDDSTDPGHKEQWNLAGGWHDAGDYNKYHNAPYVMGLAWAYEIGQTWFDTEDDDGNGRSDFLDEIVWGGDHARRMIAPDGSAYGGITSGYGFWGPPELETDNLPLTGDERPSPGPGSDPGDHAAAVAKVAKLTGDPAFVDAAARALQYGIERGQRGPRQFNAAIDLYLVTKDEKYADLAKSLAPSIDGLEVDALELFDKVFLDDHRALIRQALTEEAEKLLANAQNAFGVWTFGPPDAPNFFGTPEKESGWHVGNSQRMLEAASRVAQAYRHNPDPRYLVYVYDQLNWVFGCNPYGISLMEGVGDAFLPSYHQRLTFAGVKRGAIPGGIVNGITFKAPGDDRPFLDMSGLDIPAFEPNEVWLPHNTAFMNALVNLQRIH